MSYRVNDNYCFTRFNWMTDSVQLFYDLLQCNRLFISTQEHFAKENMNFVDLIKIFFTAIKMKRYEALDFT